MSTTSSKTNNKALRRFRQRNRRATRANRPAIRLRVTNQTNVRRPQNGSRSKPAPRKSWLTSGENNGRTDGDVPYSTSRASLNTIAVKNDLLAVHTEYLRAIVEPEAVGKASMANKEILSDVRIPDESMMPCTVAHTITNGQLSPEEDGSFLMWVYPYMKQGFNCFWNVNTGPGAGSVKVNGNTYFQQNATFDVHNLVAWENSVQDYRIISCVVKAWYVGTLLENSGKIASCCLPPNSQNYNTYDELADVPTSFQAKSVDGIRQIWFPLDYRSTQFHTVDDEPGFDNIPSIAIAGADIPGYDPEDPKYTIQFQIIVNYEIYSNSQIFTRQIANSTVPAARAVAARAASKIVSKNGGGSTNKAQDVLSFIKDAVGIAQTAASVISPFLAML